MSEFKFYKGWAEDAGRAAGLAERNGGPVEAITVRRPPNYLTAQRERVLARMRERGAERSRRSAAIDRALDEAETGLDGTSKKPARKAKP